MTSEVPGAGADDEQTTSLRRLMPLLGTLGGEVVSVGPEEVVLRLEWREELCTSNGLLHGGSVMALADSAGGACAFANLPADATGTSTIESKTNFLRAVRSGAIRARSRPLHVGRSVIVIETDVFDDEGRRVAKVIQSQTVLEA